MEPGKTMNSTQTSKEMENKGELCRFRSIRFLPYDRQRQDMGCSKFSPITGLALCVVKPFLTSDIYLLSGNISRL